MFCLLSLCEKCNMVQIFFLTHTFKVVFNDQPWDLKIVSAVIRLSLFKKQLSTKKSKLNPGMMVSEDQWFSTFLSSWHTYLEKKFCSTPRYLKNPKSIVFRYFLGHFKTWRHTWKNSTVEHRLRNTAVDRWSLILVWLHTYFIYSKKPYILM